MSLNEVTYGFVDENNIVINHAIFVDGDLDTVERVKNEYGAHAAYKVNNLLKESLAIGESYWNGLRFVHPCPEGLNGFIFDDESNMWISPIPYPEDGKYYQWDPITQSYKTYEELGLEEPNNTPPPTEE